MDSIDLGTLPTWVSAFLTSGSLALGFFILLRDRRKEELAEARKIICWYSRSDNQDENVTHVLNTSERVISNVRVLIRLRTADWAGLEGFHIAPLIRPGEEVATNTPRRAGEAKSPPEFVEFNDSDGIGWAKDLHTGLTHRVDRRYSVHSRRALRGRKRQLRQHRK
ncbi:hypothetical protein [Nocardia salmonicida]|uniref:hypothetical protein n=1 Tax=Nocardia salmonicida TaxID=53431 RepID=UPI0007A49682|nr:hypothetical protein [Nocardia salmonicida]